jgi:CHRD domain/PEP-CTERM motif
MVPTFPSFPLGVTFGTYLQTFDLNAAGSYNPAFITANGGTVAGAKATLVGGLLAGQTYLNIHTTANPGGEIRGQLVATPEPNTMVVLSTGLLGMATVLRKRKRRVS